jgi:hypothetical protein
MFRRSQSICCIRVIGRISLRKSGEGKERGRRTWKIEFVEAGAPSLIRVPDGSVGRLRVTAWVVPMTGEVVRTMLEHEINTGTSTTTGRVSVRYVENDSLQVLVPVEMHESYETRYRRIETDAGYYNFRRFVTAGRIINP